MRVAAAWTLLLATGCSSYLGTARDMDPGQLAHPGWIFVPGVPLQLQREEMDCGAAAMGMILSYWKAGDDASVLAACPPDPKRGIPATALRDFARNRGLACFLITGDMQVFCKELSRGRPVLVGLIKTHIGAVGGHYEVVVGYHPERRLVATLDPANGWRVNDEAGFRSEWERAGRCTLVVFPKEEKK